MATKKLVAKRLPPLLVDRIRKYGVEEIALRDLVVKQTKANLSEQARLVMEHQNYWLEIGKIIKQDVQSQKSFITEETDDGFAVYEMIPDENDQKRNTALSAVLGRR